MILPGLDLPLGTIWCVGRNYAEHAAEMGAPSPESPVIFTKPASSALTLGGTLRLPPDSKRVDHEVELVVARARDGSLRMAVGVDFTARDIQAELKKKGLPWTAAKGRPGFAAFGPFVPAKLPTELTLSVNGALRQRGSTADMLFSVPRLMEHLDAVYALRPGDRVEASLAGGESRLSLAVAG